MYGPLNSFGSDVDCTLHHSPWAGRNVVSEDKVKIRNVNVRRSKNVRWRSPKMGRGGSLKTRKREGCANHEYMSGTSTETRQSESGIYMISSPRIILSNTRIMVMVSRTTHTNAYIWFKSSLVVVTLVLETP